MAGKPGMQKRVPLSPHEARQRMWNAIRRLRGFTNGDIQAAAETTVTHTRKYVKALAGAGYLRVAKKRRSGYVGGHAVFALVRDTGPHAPRIGKKQVLDPNLEPAPPLPGDELVPVPRKDYERALKCVRACAGMQDPEKEVAALRAAGRPA